MMKYCRLFLVLLIMGILIVPLLHLNTAEITEQENRTLAKFPEIRNKGRFNTDYGKEFESWLGDRFWGRDMLIDARFQAMYKINGRIENEKAFIGDNGWMFEKGNTVNIPSPKKQREKIKRDAETLKRFADKFEGKNIPIYLVIVPDREQLYQRYWERYYKTKPRLDYGDEMAKLLKDSPIAVITPKEEMLETMKQEDIYYKDDLHLTSLGHNIMQRKIYSVFSSRELKNISLIPVQKRKRRKARHLAYIASKLGFPREVEAEEEIYNFSYQNSKYKEIIVEKYAIVKKSFYNGEEILFRSGQVKDALIDKTFISIGTCKSRDSFELFKPLFSRSEWIRTNIDLHGEGAKKNAIKKIKELFNLKKGSGVIVITGDISLIHDAIN